MSNESWEFDSSFLFRRRTGENENSVPIFEACELTRVKDL